MKNKTLFISATHGEEAYSVKILNSIEQKYPKNQYGYEKIIGNPKALKKKIRYIDTNLNRSAPGNKNSKLYEKKRAYEILRLADRFAMTQIMGPEVKIDKETRSISPTGNFVNNVQDIEIGERVLFVLK